MPRRIRSAGREDWSKHKGKGLIGLGVLAFVVGLMRYYAISWHTVLMVVGILLVLYGLCIKMKKKY